MDYNFDMSKGPVHASWFKGGRTNICYNALDRHVEAGRVRHRATSDHHPPPCRTLLLEHCACLPTSTGYI
jgi:hypothetical protein